MTEPQIFAGLTTIFHEAFGDETIVLHDGTTAADVPGWDSIKMVAIIIAVEEHFSVRLRAQWKSISLNVSATSFVLFLPRRRIESQRCRHMISMEAFKGKMA